MADDSCERTVVLRCSPVSSPVARKRSSKHDYDSNDGYDTDDSSSAPAMRARRSQRVKTQNTFFDPGSGEPDSLWIDSGKKPMGTVEFFTNTTVNNLPFPGHMSHLSIFEDDATVPIEDSLPRDSPNFTLAYPQGRPVVSFPSGVTFPSGRSMDYVAELNQAWVVEKLTHTIFKYLDEKLWKERIQKKVEMAMADIKHKGRKYELSKQAAKKALAESIEAYDLEEALAVTIWKSFVLERVKARTIDNVLNNHIGDVNFGGEALDEE
jgi:hypothetical protein